jgi:hypothetical protein
MHQYFPNIIQIFICYLYADSCYTVSRSTECFSAKCCHTGFHSTKCRFAGCCSTECHDAGRHYTGCCSTEYCCADPRITIFPRFWKVLGSASSTASASTAWAASPKRTS